MEHCQSAPHSEPITYRVYEISDQNEPNEISVTLNENPSELHFGEDSNDQIMIFMDSDQHFDGWGGWYPHFIIYSNFDKKFWRSLIFVTNIMYLLLAVLNLAQNNARNRNTGSPGNSRYVGGIEKPRISRNDIKAGLLV